MPFVGERSKFACLKIYDDTGSSSEDEGSKLMAKTLPIKVPYLCSCILNPRIFASFCVCHFPTWFFFASSFFALRSREAEFDLTRPEKVCKKPASCL